MKIVTHSLAALSLVALSSSLIGAGHVTFRGATAVVTMAAPGARSVGFSEGVPLVFARAVMPTSSSFGGFNMSRGAPGGRLSHLDD